MLDEKVKATIEAIRPAIQADGGDIFLRGVDEDTGVVQVELVGACVSCPASTVTLKAGIERILKDRVEGVTEVVNVGETLLDGTPVSSVAVTSVGSARWPTTPRSCSPRRATATAPRWPACSRSSSAAATPPRAVGRLTHPAGGARLHGRHHRRAGRGQVDAHQRPPPRRPGRRATRWPCSPSTRRHPSRGGAILGDRVRMHDHATDDGVFIRSMATRGHLGGLSLATPEAVRVLDAAGWPWVLIETVGVGQVEVEVAGAADTTVVVVNPGWGDAVQANKAGLLEIADVFVINKADRPGADETRRDLERMLDLTAPDGWRPPVVATTAATGEGAPELWAAIGEHRQHLITTGSLEPRRAAGCRRSCAHRGGAAPRAGARRRRPGPRGPVGRGGGPAASTRGRPPSSSSTQRR